MSGKAGSRCANIIRNLSFSASGLYALCAGSIPRQAVPRPWEEGCQLQQLWLYAYLA